MHCSLQLEECYLAEHQHMGSAINIYIDVVHYKTILPISASLLSLRLTQSSVTQCGIKSKVFIVNLKKLSCAIHAKCAHWNHTNYSFTQLCIRRRHWKVRQKSINNITGFLWVCFQERKKILPDLENTGHFWKNLECEMSAAFFRAAVKSLLHCACNDQI